MKEIALRVIAFFVASVSINTSYSQQATDYIKIDLGFKLVDRVIPTTILSVERYYKSLDKSEAVFYVSKSDFLLQSEEIREKGIPKKDEMQAEPLYEITIVRQGTAEIYVTFDYETTKELFISLSDIVQDKKEGASLKMYFLDQLKRFKNFGK